MVRVTPGAELGLQDGNHQGDEEGESFPSLWVVVQGLDSH